MCPASPASPGLQIHVVDVQPAAEPDCYAIRWQLDNPGDAPLAIVESWLPHSQFAAPRESLRPALEIPARQSRSLARMVCLPAAPDLVVENGFLNLRVQYQQQPWRFLVRMRVERRAPDSVSVNVEAITAHHVGFAEAPAKEQR